MSLIVMCALRQPSQVSSLVSMEKNECGLGELGLNAVVHGLEGHTVDFQLHSECSRERWHVCEHVRLEGRHCLHSMKSSS